MVCEGEDTGGWQCQQRKSALPEEEEEGGIWEPEEKGKGVKWVSWPAANVALTHSL